MLKRILLLFFLGALWSCNSTEEQRYEPSIPKEQIIPQALLVEMLIETHLIEAAAGIRGKEFVGEEILYTHYEDMLLTRFKVDSTTYLESLRYYLSEPKSAEKIYMAVYDSLEARRP